MDIQIEPFPSHATAGLQVKLKATPPSASHSYQYTWKVNGQPLRLPDIEQSRAEVDWDTRGVSPGTYTVEVEATLYPPGQANVPPDAERGTGKTMVVVEPRRLSIDDVMYFKRNFDQQLTGLTGAVTGIASAVGSVAARLPSPGSPFDVALRQNEILTDGLRTLAAFFGAIRNRTEAIAFTRYNEFINRLLCEGLDQGLAACRGAQSSFGIPRAGTYGAPSIDERQQELLARPGIYGVDAYNLLKLATEAFLVFEAGIAVRPPKDPVTGQFGTRDQNGVFIPATDQDPVFGEENRIGEAVTRGEIAQRLEQYLSTGTTGSTYLRRIVDALIGLDPTDREERLPYCDGILRRRFNCPSLLELIWSYWHEEGMLVQTLHAITLRFQNRRAPGDKDPLAHLEIDPLRPLNNLLWGYIQDEIHRLTVPRRAYEYDHHYGLTMYGKAVPTLRPADSRSKFLEAFHNLLYRAAVFYHEDADTTVVADAFPLLNALREVHLLLAEGAHNQFGDLPWTARVEMLIQQWLLSRPEMREFLRGRAMVPYTEPWMGQVDTMKRLQGWTEVTVTNFYELAVFGEQILLSIRYHDWSVVNDQDEAKLWARYWKPEIQRYIHSYRAATGVDLTTEPVDATMPWVLLRERLAGEQRRRAGRA